MGLLNDGWQMMVYLKRFSAGKRLPTLDLSKLLLQALPATLVAMTHLERLSLAHNKLQSMEYQGADEMLLRRKAGLASLAPIGAPEQVAVHARMYTHTRTRTHARTHARVPSWPLPAPPNRMLCTHTHTRMHTRTHARTHAHARTRAHTHTLAHRWHGGRHWRPRTGC